MPQKPLKLCYPQLANYDIPIRYYVNNGPRLEYIAPPPTTKHTIDLGAKYSPDFVCAPFKFHIGNFIEALERGANVIIQTGGTCRLGYYGELHEQILQDMGYDFQLLNLSLYRYKTVFGMVKGIKQLAPEVSYLQLMKPLPATLKMVTYLDKVDDFMRQNMGFEQEKGAFEKAHKQFLADLRQSKKLRNVKQAYRKVMDTMQNISLNKPEKPLRVGVVGEYFTIMDPSSNHEIEKKIAYMGAEVHRWMNLSNSVVICPEDGALKKLKGYLRYDMHRFPSSIWVDIQKKMSSRYTKFDTGSSSIPTIALAEHYAKQGFDGIIHVKSFGCTPEMDAVPILHNISADYKIPILYLNYDTQTSDTGIETRLEAFYDMIAMRKEVTQS